MAENETDPPAGKRPKGGKKAVLRLVEKAPVLESGEASGGEDDGSGDVRMYYSAPPEADAHDAARERGASADFGPSAAVDPWQVEPVDEGPGGEREAGVDPNQPKRPPRACDPKGFSVDWMNERYALVLHGSKAVVYHEQANAPVEEQQRVLTLEALHAWFANQMTETVNRATGKIKLTSWSQRWLGHRRRRSYQGIEFYPDRERDVIGTPGYLNLWSGYAYEPDARGTCDVFRDHLLTNVCGGAQDLFTWVFAFLAHMVQKPRERTGAALVMRGRMGAGKSIVGEVIGSLFPRHYFMVDDPRYVTGQFNAHMASCLLLQADEAVWAGDKTAEGRLKGLITSPFQQIESKGVDPIRLANYVRLIMTSNEDWVVPAGKDERRFCVLDVSPHCAQNHEYFAELWRELRADDGAGFKRLLHDLMTFDLSTVNLRQIPRTGGLLEQKIRSFTPVEAWWYDRLQLGRTTLAGDKWLDVIPTTTLYDDYWNHADRIGVKRKKTDTEFGIELRKLVPGIQRKKATIYPDDSPSSVRTRCYFLPPLADARAAMEVLLQQPVAWPPEDDGDG